MTRLTAASLAMALAPASAFASSYGPRGLGQNVDTLPAVVQDVAVVEKLGQKVSQKIHFTDTAGKRHALADFLNDSRPLIVTLGYYRCPMLCDLVDKGLVAGIKATGLKLGKDFRVLTVSVDPDETPMQASAQQVNTLRTLAHDGPREDWSFAVTDETNARALAEAVGFKYAYDAGTKQYAHAAVAFVLTPTGIISRYLYGLEFPGRDLKLALVEASGGRVGTSFDRLLLTCFRWDPALRKYGLLVWGLFKIGGTLILASVATLLAVMWRRELRMRRKEAVATQ